MKDYCVLFLVKSLGFFMSRMPYPFLGKLTEGLAAILLAVPNSRRRLLLSNLTHAFPEWNYSKTLSVAKESCARMFEMGFFSLCYPFMSSEQKRRTVFYDDQTSKQLQELRVSCRPVLMLIPHTCLFESLATSQYFRPLSGRSLGAIYRPNKNRVVDAWITKAREKVGIKTFSRKEGIIGARAHLKSANWLALLYDQNAGHRGAGTNFLGRICSVSPLPNLLAKNEKVICVHAIAQRVSFFRTKLELKVLNVRESNVSRQCHDVLESHILGCSSGFPEWLWSHGKWKINNMRHEYFQLQEKFSHLSFDRTKDRANRLAIRMPNWLGDIIMSIPVILAIKNARPDLRISLFCMKQYSEWLRSLAIAEEIIELPLKNSRIEYFLKFLSYRRHFFDAQLVLTNSLRGDVESFLVGAEKRFGMVKGYGRPLLTNFYHSEKEASLRTHQTILWGNMLNYFGLKQKLSFSPLAVSKSKQKLLVDLITIGIAPGSMNTPDKRLPVCEWVKICKSIQQRFINLQIKLRIELFGTPKDEGICNEIMECSEDVNLHDYSGKTTLVQLSDKFKKLDLLICNDSGAMHLANILGVPVAAIFSVTNKDVTGPIFDAPKFLFDFDREKPDSKFSVNFVTKLSQFFFNLNEIRKVE